MIGVGVAYVAGHGVHDALESAGIGRARAISPAAAKSCRGQRQSGNRAHRAIAAPVASCLMPASADCRIGINRSA
jgi:hypothetical protein